MTADTGLAEGFAVVQEGVDSPFSDFFSFDPSAFFGGLAERTVAVVGFDVVKV